MSSHVCIPVDKVRTLIKDLVEVVDHDYAKDLDPEVAEDPHYAEAFMRELVEVFEKFHDSKVQND